MEYTSIVRKLPSQSYNPMDQTLIEAAIASLMPVSIDEAAMALGVSGSMVRKYIKKGELKGAYKQRLVACRNRTVIPLCEVRAFQQRRAAAFLRAQLEQTCAERKASCKNNITTSPERV